MAVVTICRGFGGGGSTMGERLCERFGFRLVDASVVEQLARKARITPNWLAAMEKEAASTVLRIVSNVVSRGIFYRIPGLPEESLERQKYVAFLTQVFTAMANEGGGTSSLAGGPSSSSGATPGPFTFYWWRTTRAGSPSSLTTSACPDPRQAE